MSGRHAEREAGSRAPGGTARRPHWVGAPGAAWIAVACLSWSCGDGGPTAPPSAPPATPPATPAPPAAPAPTGVTLSVDPPAVREDAGPTTLTVTATLVGGTRAVETPISLTLEDGTATNADYAATGGTLTIAAGESSGAATLTITPVRDNLAEPDESVIGEWRDHGGGPGGHARRPHDCRRRHGVNDCAPERRPIPNPRGRRPHDAYRDGDARRGGAIGAPYAGSSM